MAKKDKTRFNMYNISDFSQLIQKIFNDQKYKKISNRIDRMHYLLINYTKQIAKIGDHLLDKCRAHEDEHRKSLKNSLDEFQSLNSEKNEPIDYESTLKRYNLVLRSLPYDWFDWRQMYSLLITMLLRATFFYHNHQIEQSFNDLKHISAILTNFPNQETMLNELKESKYILAQILTMKLLLVEHLLKNLSKDKEDALDLIEIWLSPYQIYDDIKQIILMDSKSKISIMIKHLSNLTVLELLYIVQQFDNQFVMSDSNGNPYGPILAFPKLTVNSKLSINYKESVGRNFIAEDHIALNEFIIYERPNLLVFTTEYLKNYCSYCHKTLVTFWPCQYCDEVFYCSYECCKYAWDTFHSKECGLVQFLNDEFYLLHVFRFYCIFGPQLINQCEQKLEQLNEMERNQLLLDYIANKKLHTKMMHQWTKADRIENCQIMMILIHNRGNRSTFRENYFSLLSMGLIYILMHKQIVDSELLHDLQSLSILAEQICISMFRMCTNGFCWSADYKGNHVTTVETLTSVRKRIASCICLTASMFNHSCNPNSSWEFTENGIIIKTLRSIKNGEPLTLSYGPNSAINFDQRQTRLKEDYCFFCQCDLCKNDASKLTNTMKCTASINCPGPLVLNKYETCIGCGKKPFDLIQIHRQFKSMQLAEKKFEQIFSSMVKDLEIFTTVSSFKKVWKKAYRLFGVDSMSRKYSDLQFSKNYLKYNTNNNENAFYTQISCPIDPKKIYSLEKHFNIYQSMVYGGSYNLFGKITKLIYVYSTIGQQIKILDLIDILNDCLDNINPKYLDFNVNIFVDILVYLCKLFEMFLKEFHNNNFEYFFDKNNRDDINTILLNTKLLNIVQKLNQFLLEILRFDMNEKGLLFPKLYKNICNHQKRTEQSMSSITNEVLMVPQILSTERDSFAFSKLDEKEWYYKSLYEKCQRLLTVLNAQLVEYSEY